MGCSISPVYLAQGLSLNCLQFGALYSKKGKKNLLSNKSIVLNSSSHRLFIQLR